MMIVRRQFLGSAVGTFAASFAAVNQLGELATAANSGYTAGRLNWKCDVIQSVSHHSEKRFPVVTGVDVDPTQQLMSVVGDDHYICIYDFRDGEFVRHLDKHTDWVRASRFSGDGSLLATAGNDRHLYLWSTRDFDIPVITRRHDEAIIDVAFNSGDTRLATVGFEKWLRIYDVQTGETIHKLACDCPDNHAVTFSGDGKLVAAGGRSGHIHVWDVETGKQVADYKPHRRRVRSLEFAADGMLVSGSEDQFIHITNPLATNQKRSLPRHRAKLFAVRMLNDSIIATGGSDNVIRLWNYADGTAVGTLEGHTGTVATLSLRGQQLVSGSYDTTVRVWTPTPDGMVPLNRETRLDSGWSQKK